MVKKREAIIFLSSLSLAILFLSFANAAWNITNDKNLTINNDDIISTKFVELNLSDSNVSYFLYRLVTQKDSQDNDPSKFSKLCGPCDQSKSYIKIFSTTGKDEKYTLKIMNGDNKNETKTFTIDNKNPKVLAVSPNPNKYNSVQKFISDKFNINISESNFNKTKLFTRKLSEASFTSNEMSCSNLSNNEKNCSLTLSGYTNNDQIYFYFNITDKAGNYETTSVGLATLDFTSPIISVISPTNQPQQKRFSLAIGTDEPSDILYKFDNAQKYNKLCSGCTYSTRQITLSSGQHSLDILAKDKAGNSATNNHTTFTVA